MARYDELLMQTVAALPERREDRLAAYERARRMLASRLRSADPPMPETAIESELAALDTAIERVEAELARTVRAEGPLKPSWRERLAGLTPMRVLAIGGVAIALMLGVAVYQYWAGRGQPSRAVASRGVEVDDRHTLASTSQEPLPYIFMRQIVYYRTTHPPGTVIIDKAQRYLYFVRPNVSAVRYGIGVGQECSEANGLMRVSRKEEQPVWKSVQTLGVQQYVVQRGPGEALNPLGARALYLGNDLYLIHGTDMPRSIGHSVSIGCFRLVNSDVIELFDRVALGNRVVVMN